MVQELAGYVAESPGYVHEMSSDMAKSYFAAALETGDPIFVDGTGSNQGKVQGQVDAAKAAGYRTWLVFVFVPLTVNQIRNASRARNVRASIISLQWRQITDTFVAVREEVDKAKVIVNRNDSVDEQIYLRKREQIEAHVRKTSKYSSLYDLIAHESPTELGAGGKLLSGEPT